MDESYINCRFKVLSYIHTDNKNIELSRKRERRELIKIKKLPNKNSVNSQA